MMRKEGERDDFDGKGRGKKMLVETRVFCVIFRDEEVDLWEAVSTLPTGNA